MNPSKYAFEIWTPAGLKVADFSGLASKRRVTITRNDTEDIQWRLDLNDVKRVARILHMPWPQLIQKGISEVRVRRGAKYLCGGQVTYIGKDRSSSGDWLDIRARGFLDLFADRLTSQSQVYNLIDRAAIAVDLINQSQAQGADWNYGVTIGSVPTIGAYSTTFQNTRIKDALQDLSKLLVGLDFAFTADKVFNIYKAIGTRRSDIKFTYPGNVIRLTGVGDATSIQNRLYVLGSGIGDDATIQVTREDLNSQKNYKVREKPILLSDKLDSGTLQDYGDAQLAAWGTPFDIPGVEYDAGRAPYVTDYGIGDYVQFEETDDPDSDMGGYYRIEQIALNIDEDDNETVKLAFGR